MAKAPKMVNLSIEETSGVDHPAHLHEGWMVVKAAEQSDVDAVIAALASTPADQEDSMTEQTEATAPEEADALKKAEERIAELEARLAAVAPAPEPADAEADLLKAAPEAVVKMLTEARAEKEAALAKAAEAEQTLRKERAAVADADAVEKAKAWSNLSIDPAVVGPALRRLAEHDGDLAKAITDALTAANAQAESGAIFAEIGKAAPVIEGGNAVARLQTLAKAAVDNGQAATVEQAFADLALANPALYAEYLTEKGA